MERPKLINPRDEIRQRKAILTPQQSNLEAEALRIEASLTKEFSAPPEENGVMEQMASLDSATNEQLATNRGNGQSPESLEAQSRVLKAQAEALRRSQQVQVKSGELPQEAIQALKVIKSVHIFFIGQGYEPLTAAFLTVAAIVSDSAGGIVKAIKKD